MTGSHRPGASAIAARAANLLAAGLALATCQAGPVGAQTAPLPPLQAAQPLHLPAIVQRQLPNGLRLVILEDHRQPAVWFRLAIGAGSSRDPGNRIGLAQMTAGMLDKGTTSRSETVIADTVDGLGASLGASADEDFLTVSASGLSTYTDSLLDLLADVTLHPTFPTVELERRRTQTLSAIVASLGESATVAEAAIRRRVFGSHPYGNYAAGSPESVKAITQQDLTKFHSSLFAPNNATLFMVGDITTEQAVARSQARFGSWARKAVPAAPSPPGLASSSSSTPIVIVDRPGAEQTEVRIGLAVPGYSDPNRIVARVGSAVLGLGQFEGRLTKEIRVKRGLTYGASASFDRKAAGGIFEISTYTKNASTAEVVKIALAEARRMQAEAAPSDELQERKDFLNGIFAVSVATTPGVLNRLVPAVLYGAGPDDLTQITGQTAAVTAGQIQDYWRTLPLDRPQIVLVGDASAIEPQVKSLGPVTVVPAGSLDLQSPSLTAKSDPGQPPIVPAGGGDGKVRLAAAIAALGGDAFLNLKEVGFKGEGELSPPGQDMKIPVVSATLTFVVPGKSRFELNTTFGDIIFGSDGTNKPWLSALGAVNDAPQGFSDPTDLLRRAAQNTLEVSLVPDLKDESGTFQGIAVKDEKGRITRVYLDTATQLPRKIVAGSAQGSLDVALGDYHVTDTVKLPGTLKVSQGGKAIVTLKFNGWSINKAVDEKLFARPK